MLLVTIFKYLEDTSLRPPNGATGGTHNLDSFHHELNWVAFKLEKTRRCLMGIDVWLTRVKAQPKKDVYKLNFEASVSFAAVAF